jgi:hypothetical protein
MSKTILVLPDSHAHYQHNNDRADWLSKLVIDLKPDIFVNLGDQFDMPSLSSYDKGKRSFHGKSYKKDIEAGLEFHDRLWGPVRATKKKMPHRIFLEGNHEARIERALDLSPELQGTIGFQDYALDDYYHEVVRYNGQLPGITKIEGILFAHFFPTGVSGRPVGGISPARMLGMKNKTSCVAGHIHTFDFFSERNIDGRTINCLVAGCYQDYINDWSGPIGEFWRPGVAILRGVENGNFDLEWISIERIKAAYSEPQEVEFHEGF